MEKMRPLGTGKDKGIFSSMGKHEAGIAAK
jgi:hypothetical protein